MIKINLALKKTATVAASAGDPKAVSGFEALKHFNLQDLKDMPKLRGVLVLVVTYFVGGYLIEDFQAREIAELDAKVTEARTKQTALKKELEKTKKYDEIKKSLESDEIVIRTKLDTIEKLVKDRGGTPRVLLALSSAIPKDVWLKDLKIDSAIVDLQGASADSNQVYSFMKGLGESAAFKEVNLKGTTQVKEEGIEVVSFDATVKRR